MAVFLDNFSHLIDIYRNMHPQFSQIVTNRIIQIWNFTSYCSGSHQLLWTLVEAIVIGTAVGGVLTRGFVLHLHAQLVQEWRFLKVLLSGLYFPATITSGMMVFIGIALWGVLARVWVLFVYVHTEVYYLWPIFPFAQCSSVNHNYRMNDKF